MQVFLYKLSCHTLRKEEPFNAELHHHRSGSVFSVPPSSVLGILPLHGRLGLSPSSHGLASSSADGWPSRHGRLPWYGRRVQGRPSRTLLTFPLISGAEDTPIPADQCPEADDVCTFIYTSGTTGKSKGVMLHHKPSQYLRRDKPLRRAREKDRRKQTCHFRRHQPLRCQGTQNRLFAARYPVR